MVVIAVIVIVYSLSGYISGTLSQYIQHILSQEMGHSLDRVQLISVYGLSLGIFLRIMAPIFAVAIIFGVLINLVQVGMAVASEGLKPKLSNINPIEGFKRIFSKKAVFDFVKTLIKLIVIGVVVFHLVQKALPEILGLLNMQIVLSADYFIKLAFRISITAMGVFMLIALMDFVYQKWEYNRSLKMSKEEIRKEMKQTEGDPLVKAMIREKQRMMSMRRMMHSIPEATVVVTNPSHLAVVLKYEDDEMDAPQIVAKGAGYVAAKIKEIALEHEIPLIEDKAVARALYKNCEIGDYIPVELYQAVAAIIAHIYTIQNK